MFPPPYHKILKDSRKLLPGRAPQERGARAFAPFSAYGARFRRVFRGFRPFIVATPPASTKICYNLQRNCRAFARFSAYGAGFRPFIAATPPTSTKICDNFHHLYHKYLKDKAACR